MSVENVYVVRTGRNFESISIYGSIKAIGDNNPKEKIGVSLRVLYGHGFDTGEPYENAYTKIEKQTVIRSLQKPKKNGKYPIKRSVKGTGKKIAK
jgi:hypothetical protein